MFSREPSRVLGRITWRIRSQRRHGDRVRNVIGRFGRLRAATSITLGRSGESQSPSMKDSPNPIVPPPKNRRSARQRLSLSTADGPGSLPDRRRTRPLGRAISRLPARSRWPSIQDARASAPSPVTPHPCASAAAASRPLRREVPAFWYIWPRAVSGGSPASGW